MRIVFVFAFAICLVTTYHPAVAVVADDTVEAVHPVSHDTMHKQSDPGPTGLKPDVLIAGSRGRMLHENHCASCHESMVYIRAKRKAKNYKEVRNWVNQRANWLGLGWTSLEKQEVTQYLNERYYKYPIPK